MPSEPRSPYDPHSASAEVLRGFGLEALVEIVETIGYGVCVTGDDAAWMYLNPAGARMVGARLDELAGAKYLDSFPEHERVPLLALEEKQREGDTGFYTNTLIRPDGSTMTMTWSGTVVEVEGAEVAPAFFHETAPGRQVDSVASPLGHAASRLAQGASAREVLAALVAEAVEATRALGAALLVADADGFLDVVASYGVPASLAEAVRRSPARIGDLPAGEVVTRGRGGFLHDDRRRLGSHPVTASWVAALAEVAWQGAAKVPLVIDGEVRGVLVVIVPERITAPSESETALWERLAEHAEVALGTAKLRDHAYLQAVASERERIARDLHDSVNHAIFALRARAQAVERLLVKEQFDKAREVASGLAELAAQATAEMRSLLDDMRHTGSARRGLQASLRELLDQVERRDGLVVALAVPDGVGRGLTDDEVEHVVRVVAESLHNVVKHADANRVSVRVLARGHDLEVRVEDDGRGFDTAVARRSGHGQRTVRERAELLGAQVSVVSATGEGTTVVLRLPGRA